MMIVDPFDAGRDQPVSKFLFKRWTLCSFYSLALFKSILQLFVFISLYICWNNVGLSVMHEDGWQNMVQ